MFRGWSQDQKRGFVGMLNGVVPNKDRFQTWDHIYHHRKALDGTAQTLKFFKSDVSANKGDGTNWPSESGLPAEVGFWCMGFAIGLEFNNSVAGDEVAGTETIEEAAAATSTATFLGQVAALFQTGRVNFDVGGRRYLPDVYGLNKFPVPWGLTGSLAFATAVGATNLSVQGAILNNGTAHKDNYHRFRPWVEILPQTEVGVEITWTSARTLAANPTIGVYLIGKAFRVAGR
jgi:hypothetical protein